MDKRFQRLFGSYSKEKLQTWYKWHQANPHVYECFRKLAHHWKGRSPNLISANLIGNVVRFEIETTRGDDYKVRNDWFPLFARYLVWQEPEFEGCFAFKKYGS